MQCPEEFPKGSSVTYWHGLLLLVAGMVPYKPQKPVFSTEILRPC